MSQVLDNLFLKMHKNIFIISLKKSFVDIWRNKSLFLLLFILQVIFFASLFLLSNNYIPKMMESAKAIQDYLSNLNFDENAITSGIMERRNPLGDDPLSISRNFNDILVNFRLYIISLFVLILLFISISWSITHKLIHKLNLRQFTRYFFKILTVSFFYLILIFSFFFSLFNISLADITIESAKLFSKYIPFLIFSIVLAYFMFISLSLLHKAELRNIVQKTLTIGIKKIHYVFLLYLIIILLVMIPTALTILWLTYFETGFFILMFSSLVMIFSFVFGRILMVNFIEKLADL